MRTIIDWKLTEFNLIPPDTLVAMWWDEGVGIGHVDAKGVVTGTVVRSGVVLDGAQHNTNAKPRWWADLEALDPRTAPDVGQQLDDLRRVVARLCECIAATAETLRDLKSTSKYERTRQLSLCTSALACLKAEAPVGVRVYQGVEDSLKSAAMRLERFVNTATAAGKESA